MLIIREMPGLSPAGCPAEYACEVSNNSEKCYVKPMKSFCSAKPGSSSS